MSLFIGVVMDPISTINPTKDTTLGLQLAAQARGHRLAYMEQSSLY
ncbi:MAG: glutathione synthase, partial [Luminiphilus sp.]|nr:glutathione synthase [Luminiphilus sp.]